MSTVIAITNQKGGVGKTTTSCALACGLAMNNKRVLAVDLDPQGNLGFSLGLQIESGATIYEVLKG
ncbi:MAG: ParA family protein, partial [Lacrimispora sphenoides]